MIIQVTHFHLTSSSVIQLERKAWKKHDPGMQ